jgi:hypothetical protein
MTDVQLFALVILPVCVGVIGIIAVWAARFIP